MGDSDQKQTVVLAFENSLREYFGKNVKMGHKRRRGWPPRIVWTHRSNSKETNKNEGSSLNCKYLFHLNDQVVRSFPHDSSMDITHDHQIWDYIVHIYDSGVLEHLVH